VRQIVDSIALESNETRNILRIRKKVAMTS